MNLVVLSNAAPPDGVGLLRRTPALAPVLLAWSSQGPVESHPILKADGPLALSLFVTQPARWPQPSAGAATILPVPVRLREVRSFSNVLAALREERPDLLWIDYDPAAGKSRDRLEFLQVAGSLAASAEAEGWTLGVALPDDLGTNGDTGLFSGRSLSIRQILNRLVDRCSRLITFSTGAAGGLSKRFRRRFEVVPVSSLIPATELSRAEARSQLGFPEASADLLVGVLGRYSGIAWDLLQAGLKEAVRLSPGAKALYLGPDGQRFRERSMPLPFLDAGTPEPREVAMRLRAMDFVVLPNKEGCQADDQSILACLCNGTQIVATAPGSGIDPAFGALPGGFSMVPGNELGSFLEAIERSCERALGGGAAMVEAELRAYYAGRFSAREMCGWLAVSG